jgi:RNA polymerase sigma-70 factor (ECF subfamily)
MRPPNGTSHRSRTLASARYRALARTASESQKSMRNTSSILSPRVKSNLKVQFWSLLARHVRNCRNMHELPVGDLAEDLPGDEAVDQRLMERLHRGDHDAATHIYVRYADRLLGVARRHTPTDLQTRVDPEDVVQSVFRTFFRRAAGGAYAVPEGEELWKLFLVIALNKIRRLGKFHRARKRDVRQTQLIAPHGDDDAQEGGDSLRILELTIDELLNQCPEHARQMVRLRVDGFEVSEIASRSGRSKRSVERVLQQFRELLTRTLEDAHDAAKEPQP